MTPARPCRRDFFGATASLAGGILLGGSAGRAFAAEMGKPEAFFTTRGIVLGVRDLQTLDWPQLAKRAGLTTIGTHVSPQEVAAFLATDSGRRFLEACRENGIQVEHELHAMSDLLPRSLFEKDPTMFRMDEHGRRVREFNLCVHSKNALEVVCENAVKYAMLLRPTTGRYFYWIDDGRPMCLCKRCRGLSVSDQAMILENRILDALRGEDPRATVAHLAYHKTAVPPTQVKPKPGIFLEFAPIERHYDRPLSSQTAALETLDANLAVFGREGAQALEYWLDLSLFSKWKRENIRKLPWHEKLYLADLKTYAERGVRNVTSFGVYLDGDYVKRFGDPPVNAYAAGMGRWRLVGGKSVKGDLDPP